MTKSESEWVSELVIHKDAKHFTTINDLCLFVRFICFRWCRRSLITDFFPHSVSQSLILLLGHCLCMFIHICPFTFSSSLWPFFSDESVCISILRKWEERGGDRRHVSEWQFIYTIYQYNTRERERGIERAHTNSHTQTLTHTHTHRIFSFTINLKVSKGKNKKRKFGKTKQMCNIMYV